MNNPTTETNHKVRINSYKLHGLPSFNVYLSCQKENILKLEWKLKNNDVIKKRVEPFKTIREELDDVETKIVSFSSKNKYRVLHKLSLIKQLILSLE